MTKETETDLENEHPSITAGYVPNVPAEPTLRRVPRMRKPLAQMEQETLQKPQSAYLDGQHDSDFDPRKPRRITFRVPR